MNGGKLPDGGILYDGTEEDDEEVSSRPSRCVLVSRSTGMWTDWTKPD